MDEVVAALGDERLIDDMTERAYREVACAQENRYAAFVEKVDNALEAAFEPSMAAADSAYGREEIARLARRDLRSHGRRLKTRHSSLRLHPGLSLAIRLDDAVVARATAPPI